MTRTKMNRSGPGGHFGWKDVGEQKAYEKACQALRENAPESRKQQCLAAKHNHTKKQQLAAPISLDGESHHSQSGEGKGRTTATAGTAPLLQVKGET